jgi:hypothetical protein
VCAPRQAINRAANCNNGVREGHDERRAAIYLLMNMHKQGVPLSQHHAATRLLPERSLFFMRSQTGRCYHKTNWFIWRKLRPSSLYTLCNFLALARYKRPQQKRKSTCKTCATLCNSHSHAGRQFCAIKVLIFISHCLNRLLNLFLNS